MINLSDATIVYGVMVPDCPLKEPKYVHFYSVNMIVT